MLEANLIHQTRSERYRFHELLRCYAADLASRDESQQRAALARLFDHYTRTASVAANILYPHEAHQHPNIPGPSTPAPALIEAYGTVSTSKAPLVAGVGAVPPTIAAATSSPLCMG